MDQKASFPQGLIGYIGTAKRVTTGGHKMELSQENLSLLIYLDFSFLALVTICAVVILWRTQKTDDLEIIKFRFASVTFTGIMAVFVFTAVLYFVTRDNVGAQIFDRAVTAMTPLAGVILGYMFQARGQAKPLLDDSNKPAPPANNSKRNG